MKTNISLDETAKNKMLEEINNDGKILEIGPLCNPLFRKEDSNVFYADIKNTEEVKTRYNHLPHELYENIVNIDYVIRESYNNTFKENNEKFDYVVSSHVFEHIPNPIDYLLDISTILKVNGKLCMLMPDKEFTFDHYRENSSFADMFDVYTRGESNNTPRIFLDFEFCRVEENNYLKYWNKSFSEYPNPNTEFALEEYKEYIYNFENKKFDSHYWVFTDRSFLRILENLMRSNMFPYKLVSFFPTAYNDNTFGVILELDYSMKENSEFREQQINQMHEISKNIEKERFKIDAQGIIQENFRLKKTVNKLLHQTKSSKTFDYIVNEALTENTGNITIGDYSNKNIEYSFENTGLLIQNKINDGGFPSFNIKKGDNPYFIPNTNYFAIEFDLIELEPSNITLYFSTPSQNTLNEVALTESHIGSTLKYEFTDKLRIYEDYIPISTRDYNKFKENIGIRIQEWGQKTFKIKIANLKIYPI